MTNNNNNNNNNNNFLKGLLEEYRQDERVLKNRINSLVRNKRKQDKIKKELLKDNEELEREFFDKESRDFKYIEMLKKQIIDLGGKPKKRMFIKKRLN